MLHELVRATRTVRRFDQARRLRREQLMELIDLARLGGSARNAQVLRYLPVTEPDRCDRIFPFLAWAGYLPEWPGPEPGEQPPAYVLCLLDQSLLKGPEHEARFDLGIASQNLLLGAAEQQILGCRIAAFSPKLEETLALDERYRLLLVIALGYPRETVVIDPVEEGGGIRYWRDEQAVHHVPKRSLEDLVLAWPPSAEGA